tara:strand:+ start:1490 stop:2422 length:933 start_codon:yes stop_codon:yes gene_type:complete
MFSKKSKIFVAGHNGMVGSAIYKKLKKENFKNLITVNKSQLDLLNQEKVNYFIKRKKPDYVIVAAARVGGIVANSNNKASFIYENLQIQNNLIHSSYKNGVKNLLFLGSSCIYPKGINVPISEKRLLDGKLEKTNDSYAIAKIAGLKMCQDYSNNYNLNYKSLMPSNMYGPGDNYDLVTSHFFAALIKKTYLASKSKNKILKIWGSGKPRRELLFVEDFASAVLFFLKKKFKEPFLNIGTGVDHSIKWYADFIIKELGGNIKIKFQKNKPDGMFRKKLDISLAKKYGWKPKTTLKEGFSITLDDFKKNNT